MVAFGADQFGRRPGGDQKWSYFNLYFFSMGLAVLLALTVVVYIQENVGWGWGFGIPAIAMFLSVMSFVAGVPALREGQARGRCRSSSPRSGRGRRNCRRTPDRCTPVPQQGARRPHRRRRQAAAHNQLRFLDRAAVVTPGDVRRRRLR
ncbi:unnamed protein product [Urochloa humidicola]